MIITNDTLGDRLKAVGDGDLTFCGVGIGLISG